MHTDMSALDIHFLPRVVDDISCIGQDLELAKEKHVLLYFLQLQHAQLYGVNLIWL